MNKRTKNIIRNLLRVLKPKHKEGYNFSGSCDLLIFNSKTKEIELIDWKTKSDFNPTISFKTIHV